MNMVVVAKDVGVLLPPVNRGGGVVTHDHHCAKLSIAPIYVLEF
jgi:hypothetical protein